MVDWSSSLPAFGANPSQVVLSGRVSVVLIWAAWDPVCQVLDTKLHAAQGDHPNLQFSAMNLDQSQNWPLAMKWGVHDTRALVCLFSGSLHELAVVQGRDVSAKAKLADWNKLAEEQKETR